jgi:hypothetical protein
MYSNSKASDDSFGPFLRTVRGMESSSVEASPNTGVLPTRVLEVLGERGPLSAHDLLAASRISVLEIAGVLKTMGELGLIEVSQPPGSTEEIVRLSPAGARLVARSR